MGLFEWPRIPFGLMSASEEFQGFMDCLYGMRDEICIAAYLENVVVFSKSLEEHLDHTRQVLQRLRAHEIKEELEAERN